METQQTQEKPRLSYADFIAAQRGQDFPEWSVAYVIQWYIRAMNGWNGKRAVKPMGESKQYILLRLQRDAIGKQDGRQLTGQDIIDLCERRLEEVCPATVNQDVNYLHGALKYVKAAPGGCKDLKASAIADVRPFLISNGFVGKSTPRNRVPTDDEIQQLLAEAAKPPKRPNKGFIYAMPDIIACGLVSSRRLGEICGLRRSKCDWENKDPDGNPAPMYTVEKMKHPTKKDHTKTFPIPPELAVILQRQPIVPGKEDFFFPFRKQSVGARYTRLKARLGIKNLHFHDNRRAAITRYLQEGMSPHQVSHFVSGHEDGGKMIAQHYDATNPVLGHAVFRKIAQTQALR